MTYIRKTGKTCQTGEPEPDGRRWRSALLRRKVKEKDAHMPFLGGNSGSHPVRVASAVDFLLFTASFIVRDEAV